MSIHRLPQDSFCLYLLLLKIKTKTVKNACALHIFKTWHYIMANICSSMNVEFFVESECHIRLQKCGSLLFVAVVKSPIILIKVCDSDGITSYSLVRIWKRTVRAMAYLRHYFIIFQKK